MGGEISGWLPLVHQSTMQRDGAYRSIFCHIDLMDPLISKFNPSKKASALSFSDTSRTMRLSLLSHDYALSVATVDSSRIIALDMSGNLAVGINWYTFTHVNLFVWKLEHASNVRRPAVFCRWMSTLCPRKMRKLHPERGLHFHLHKPPSLLVANEWRVLRCSKTISTFITQCVGMSEWACWRRALGGLPMTRKKAAEWTQCVRWGKSVQNVPKFRASISYPTLKVVSFT